MPSFSQLAMGGDGSVDLGFGVGANYLNRLCAANGNQAAASDAGNNMEIIQRLNAMLEGNLDLGGMTDVTPKRSYQQDAQLSVSELFGYGVNGANGNQMTASQQEDFLFLLQQHQISQAVQQLEQQQRQQQQQHKFSSSLLMNKNDSQTALSKLMPNSGSSQQQRSVRQSTVSSGIGDSPLSSGSSPVPRGSRSQSISGGYSLQAGAHSTPTSNGRAIRGASVFSRESGSPALEQVLMGCQRGADVQGTSPAESDLSMLSSSGISSVESSLTELMQSMHMSGSSGAGVSASNPFAAQGLQLSYQQQQQLQNSRLQATLQAALQQSGLAQLGSLTGSDMSPQSLQTLQTNLQNLQELANLQNLQAWQNLRNLQSLQAMSGAGGLSSLLGSSPGALADRSSPLAALAATESSLHSSPWSPSLALNSGAPYSSGGGGGGGGSGGGANAGGGGANSGSASGDNSNLERAARLYRNAAALCDATCTWSGHLPPRSYKNATYSCKVFLGGVPWDITEVSLTNAFKQFGSIKIEWPGKSDVANPPKGYVYIIFDNEKHVKSLLQACTHDYSNGGSWYYKISSRRMRSKEVQVIPWMLSDSNYVRSPTQRLDPQKTVFVGALHGMLNAEGLAHIMNDLFGGVLYAGIDTDKFKYPIGSGRVTFNNNRSYMKAVAAAFIEIKTPKFTKKVQVDPYLEDSLCANCGVQQGPYFCRDLTCFKYFCRSCWQWQHNSDVVKHHRPLMRHYKGAGNVGQGSAPTNPGSPVSQQQQQHQVVCDLQQQQGSEGI